MPKKNSMLVRLQELCERPRSGPLSVEEIATHCAVTPRRVQQLEASGLQKMQKILRREKYRGLISEIFPQHAAR